MNTDRPPSPFFNLIDEPWLPVIDTQGEQLELSLADTFRHSEEVVSLAGDAPTQPFANLRLLLAILHRAVEGPTSIQHWQQIRDHWNEAVELVIDYLEQFRDRFWLQHPTHPFMQVAGLEATNGEIASLDRIISDSLGNQQGNLMMMRVGEPASRIGWAEAARWLIHTQAFDIAGIHTGAVGDPRVKGGKGYSIGTGWDGQIGGVSAVGTSLKETLLFNLIATEVVNLDGGPADLPVWERPPLGPQPDGWPTGGTTVDLPYRIPTGPVDLYTWQSRRIRLVGDDSSVTGVINAQGDKIDPNNRFSCEPMTAWYHSGPQSKKLGSVVFRPIRHVLSRAFWRGLTAFLPKSTVARASGGEPAQRQAPALMQWLSVLSVNGLLLDDTFGLAATGIEYGAQEAAVVDTISDHIALPTTLLGPRSRDFTDVVESAIRAADEAVFALGNYATNIALASGATPDSEGPKRRVTASAYAALGALFRDWVITLETNVDLTERQNTWQALVRNTINVAAQQVFDDGGPAALVGRTIGGKHLDAGLAEQWLRRRLRDVLPYAHPDNTANTSSTFQPSAPLPQEVSK